MNAPQTPGQVPQAVSSGVPREDSGITPKCNAAKVTLRGPHVWFSYPTEQFNMKTSLINRILMDYMFSTRSLNSAPLSQTNNNGKHLET